MPPPKVLSVSSLTPPIRRIQPTVASLRSTDVTYDQASVTYDDPLIDYGGSDGNDGPGPSMIRVTT